ncbi:TIGR03792 family protein [Cyanobium sp. PCC 7001]|uniref:TIGR03792 family protein n=1 Tax=Cyanobium sp. PCC 7001 TaxID=180281 RepID=UPI001CED64BA|nr:TIGR03792 family protein [Cyanobium sp. PCC 7001]
MAEPRAEQPPKQPPMDAQSEVVEVLRLQVPARSRQAWLEAEQASWEPWLARQEGFLGRQLFWDPQREEGLLLIRWASRGQWKAISPEAVGAVQERFEQHARQLTGSRTNPFPLLDEAELQPL